MRVLPVTTSATGFIFLLPEKLATLSILPSSSPMLSLSRVQARVCCHLLCSQNYHAAKLVNSWFLSTVLTWLIPPAFETLFIWVLGPVYLPLKKAVKHTEQNWPSWPFIEVQFMGIKSIHIVELPSPPSVHRTLSSCKRESCETLWNTSCPCSAPSWVSPWLLNVVFQSSAFWPHLCSSYTPLQEASSEPWFWGHYLHNVV